MESDQRRSISDGDRLAWLTLKLIPELGNRSLLRLIGRFRTPQAILGASAAELQTIPRLHERARTALLSRKSLPPPEKEWEQLQRDNLRLLCLHDPDYPDNLKTIPDPPAVLFVRGSLDPRDLVSVAVVGSRAASPAGIAFTEKLCRDLAAHGVTIVSGLALGIDSAAHRGALRENGRTFAVLGCGLDIYYPYKNSSLHDKIAESGALFSEFPLGTDPIPWHFPARNRIISGLSLGVVVVEAAQRSGSLITARLALEQGKDVFAVPGMAMSFRSIGPHALIRQGAKLAEKAEDILEEILPSIRPSWSPNATTRGKPEIPRPELTPDEKEITDQLDTTPTHVDEICRACDRPVSGVMTILTALELRGIVKQLPGKYFILSFER
jgi:DNA processing protein